MCLYLMMFILLVIKLNLGYDMPLYLNELKAMSSFLNVPSSTAAVSSLVKTGAGILKRVVINQPAVSTSVVLRDGLSSASTVFIGSPALGASVVNLNPLQYDLNFDTGLHVITPPGWDITVVYD